jgi:lipoate---protein ligase
MDVLAEQPVTIDSRANLALDEALLRAAPRAPLLRTWVGSRCVVVGRGQPMSREVDLAACARDRIPVFRRSSSGSAWFHDPGTLHLTLVRPGWRPDVARDLADVVASALTGLGLRPYRDTRGVHLDGGLTCGISAQTTHAASLAHATLLVTTPAALVATYLYAATPDPLRPGAEPPPARPLAAYLPALDLTAAAAAIGDTVAARHGPLIHRPPTPQERHWRDLLLAERYLRQAWHLGATTVVRTGSGIGRSGADATQQTLLNGGGDVPAVTGQHPTGGQPSAARR